VSVLCYHTVDPAWRSGLSMDPRIFRAHGQWLARHRRVVDLDTAISLMDRRGRLPRGVSCLTFDDGLAGLYEHALPVLRDLRLPATVFVVAGTLSDQQAVDWIDDPPDHQLVTLSFEQLQDMAESGIAIASHSQTHHVLTELDRDRCEQDLTDSRQVLEELFARPVRHLAYPRGLHDEGVREAARRAGYRQAFALPVGPEPVGPFSLPRVGVYRHDGLSAVRVKSARGYAGLRNRLHPDVVRAARRVSGRITSPTPASERLDRSNDDIDRGATEEAPRCAS
jgi:peptidoglycan/xylan/chitin deacetylase (PgdA/CDA1 family)